jgi:hypothetical protein
MSPAWAQEHQGCFMVDRSGRLINLSSICPSAPLVEMDTPQLGTGDIQVTLRWQTTDDLDLGVTDPKGDTVTFFNPTSPSGGLLDADANAGCESSAQSPIEHIFWRSSQAPTGTYTISVKLFSRCGGTGSIPFTVTLLVQGKTQTLTGTVDDAAPTKTFPFSFP